MKSNEGVSREMIHELHTIEEIKSFGTYCRGGPPWPPGAELDLGNTPAAKNGIRRRAATEGRPYSTFRGA